MVDEVGLVEDRFVAERDDVLEADAVVVGPVEHRRDERPGLAHKREPAGKRVLRPERGVHSRRCRHDTQAVGADEVQLVLVGYFGESALACRTVLARLAEPRGDHDDVADARLPTRLDRVQHDRRRDDDDRHVGVRVADRVDARYPEHLVVVRVDGHRLAVEVLEQVRRDGTTDRALASRRADDRDPIRVEQFVERTHRPPSMPSSDLIALKVLAHQES